VVGFLLSAVPVVAGSRLHSLEEEEEDEKIDYGFAGRTT
jgi:hypothetical protein